MKLLRPAVIALTVAALLAGCAPTRTSDSPKPTITNTAAIPTRDTLTSNAPNGLLIPGGKVQWIPIAPDPRKVNLEDPEQVIKAYIETANTWDSQIDKTDAYALQRAAIYLTPTMRTAQADYDPDAAKSQSAFLKAKSTKAYTQVKNVALYSEGMPTQDQNTYQRAVSYVVKTIPRVDNATSNSQKYLAWVIAVKQGNHWYIQSAQTQTDD